MKVWTTIRANALVAGDLMEYALTQWLIEDIVVKDSDHLSVRFKDSGAVTVFWDEPVRVLREEPAPEPQEDQPSKPTSDKVREALAYISTVRRGGQPYAANLLNDVLTSLISDNLKTHNRARQEAIQAVRRRVEGLTAVGNGALKMQFAVLEQLDLMEGPQ